MSTNDKSNPYGVATAEQVPLPPKNADVLTTACDYCTIACGYKVYRWPVGKDGGMKASQNAYGVDFPTGQMMGKWASPSQHNIVSHNGKPHHVVVIPDFDTKAVNMGGNHSIRGGTIAQKCFNPENRTRERLQHPMIRVNGKLTPVSWDLATDVMADISKYVIKKHGEHAWAIKMYSYQYFENTYAITKLGMTSIGTPAIAPHDKCSNTNDATGLDDVGIDSFAASYKDWADCEVAFLSGVDPYETKTTLFTTWMMPGDKKFIFVTPHKTMGAAWAEKEGRGLWLGIIPGTDSVLHMALARIVIENGWQDQEFIDTWIANSWEVDSGYGRGTRNTGWQWRTTWGTWQSDWEDYKKFILSQEESKLDVAAKITGLNPADIQKAAEWIAKPRADGSRPKTSFMLEKGNYWSNNYMNTTSLASLGLICGAGNRPGRVISRGGGHQRGMMGAGGGSGWLSPEKYPGRRKKSFNLDRWVMNGEVKFAWVFGTTWTSSMMASNELERRMAELTSGNPHQIRSLDRQAIFETLKKRVDNGGMVMVDSDIYPVRPVGTDFADIVLPAATWGEDNFTRCNSERRLRLYSKFYDAPGEAKPDWWAVQQFAKKMGFDADGSYGWKDSNDIFEEAARFGRNGVLNYHPLVVKAKADGVKGQELLRSYGTDGIQTPIRMKDNKLIGTQRLHDPANDWEDIESVEVKRNWLYAFNTHSGKAILLKSPWGFKGWSQFYAAVQPRKEKGEIWITNGRLNEMWQSGFDDNRKPYLSQRWPFPAIIIHPNDAKRAGIESGDWVEIVNDAVYVQVGEPIGVQEDDLFFDTLMKNGHIKTTVGKFKAVALVSDEIREGVAKAGFNDPRSQGNAVVHAVPDPVTNNYRYKLGRGVLRKVGESEYKHAFNLMSFKPRNIA
ncbi:arsenate reductase (azurin) large subunit [Sulfurivermis fontis]|uniref:arsenate reductase (azurin) large subunit n=1 Tax=Sulfurivermis fontis TaxID=1972068 RepID=UPI000FD793F8|nr:arsenate reductase (azurin) large subunit [Sulfurivermis fontis]